MPIDSIMGRECDNGMAFLRLSKGHVGRAFVVAMLRLGSIAMLRAASPDDFIDIPWFASPPEVKRIMEKRTGVKLKNETATSIVYEGGAFADYPVERYQLELTDGKFTGGTVYVTIPSGTDKSGTLLRNKQFEELSKSLSRKYGKGKRSGDGRHTQEDWSWASIAPRGGEKRAVAILLSYSWEPYEFIVRYSNGPFVPPPAPEPTPKKTKKKDL